MLTEVEDAIQASNSYKSLEKAIIFLAFGSLLILYVTLVNFGVFYGYLENTGILGGNLVGNAIVCLILLFNIMVAFCIVISKLDKRLKVISRLRKDFDEKDVADFLMDEGYNHMTLLYVRYCDNFNFIINGNTLVVTYKKMDAFKRVDIPISIVNDNMENTIVVTEKGVEIHNVKDGIYNLKGGECYGYSDN